MSNRTLTILAICFIVLCIFIGFLVKDRLQKDAPQEEILALSQNDVEDTGEITIVQEDEEEDTTPQEEIDLSQHHFTFSVDGENLSIKSPVVDGVSEASLSRGIGRHVTTANPNRETGNVVLSGHQWFPGDRPAHKVFENLDQLEIGQEVEVKYGGEIFTYKIRESKIVEPTDVSILEQTKDPQLTLYTCYPKYTTDQRLVFIADLLDVRPAGE